MGFVEKDAEDVIEVLKRWDPGTAFSEAACQRTLAKFLQREFPKQKVLCEHPIGRGRADIFIDFKDWTMFGAKVVIELKHNLQTLNEYHRLVGQLSDYVGIGKAEVIVVLCGTTSQQLAGMVLERMQEMTAGHLFWKGAVIPKPFTARAASGRFVAVRSGEGGR
jgi:hypothetical protein